VIATTSIGQAPQALLYVPGAVPSGAGTENLQPLGVAGKVTQLLLAPSAASGEPPTSVSLYDQGLIQVLEASVTGLQPEQPYLLALSEKPHGTGALQPLQPFTTNAAGAAIVNAIGPIRQLVRKSSPAERRYLVILSGTADKAGPPVQVESTQPVVAR
jgi:hypothetical protein